MNHTMMIKERWSRCRCDDKDIFNSYDSDSIGAAGRLTAKKNKLKTKQK